MLPARRHVLTCFLRLLLFAGFFALLHCTAQKRPSLLIFAAASLEAPLDEVVAAFQAKHPEVDIQCQYAGSQILSHQILEGAPADLFLSAHPDYLGLLDNQLGPPRTFAGNTMVLAVSRASFAKRPDFARLEEAAFSLVMAGPEVPAGRYGRAALGQAGVKDAWQERLLSLENSVVGVTTKLLAEEAQVGVLYGSEAAALPRERFWILPLPEPAEDAPHYTAALVKTGRHQVHAQAFLDFLQTPEAASLLQARGLRLP